MVIAEKCSGAVFGVGRQAVAGVVLVEFFHALGDAFGAVACFVVEQFFGVDSREGSAAGIIVTHLVSCVVMLTQSIASSVWFSTEVFNEPQFSDLASKELVLQCVCALFSVICILCLLDLMKNLYRCGMERNEL